jgi:two-component system, LytTR family, sensor kinase
MPVFKRKIFFSYLPLVLLWLLVTFFMSVIYYNPNSPFLPQLYISFLSTTLSVPACWYAANKLVPNFLYKKRIGGFIGRIILLTLTNVIVVYLICNITYHLATGIPIITNTFILLTITLLFLFVNLIFISIACGIKIIADRYSLEDHLHEIEKEKITTELNFLRSQINPHFLFNILNSIYFQIDKSNILARGSVEKFSEMLRYQLYDCNTDAIEIKKEIDYIQSYVAMQSQRLEPGTDIQLTTGDGLEGFAIAPFMILTLVENAFKHISHFKRSADNKIYIDIHKKEHLLIVKATNTYEKDEKVTHLVQSGGLGIQNLKRRLELLYPDKAQLSVYNTNRIFESVLNLKLS